MDQILFKIDLKGSGMVLPGANRCFPCAVAWSGTEDIVGNSYAFGNHTNGRLACISAVEYVVRFRVCRMQDRFVK